MLASTSGCKKARERERGREEAGTFRFLYRMDVWRGMLFATYTGLLRDLQGREESQTMQKWGKGRKESNDFALFGVFGSEIKKEGKKDPCLSERTTRGVGIPEMSIENSVSRVTGRGEMLRYQFTIRQIFFSLFLSS